MCAPILHGVARVYDAKALSLPLTREYAHRGEPDDVAYGRNEQDFVFLAKIVEEKHFV